MSSFVFGGTIWALFNMSQEQIIRLTTTLKKQRGDWYKDYFMKQLKYHEEQRQKAYQRENERYARLQQYRLLIRR